MQLEILRCLSGTKIAHKTDLLGRHNQPGSLEKSFGITFDSEQRQLADQAFEGLKTKSFICPNYRELIDPERWVEITPSGKEAFERGALDSLDSALLKISPHLVEVRAGAWEAVSSDRAASLRQAAHSGR